MFDDLLRANEASLFERFIHRCVAPSLVLTALLHADFGTRPAYVLVEEGIPLEMESYRGPTCSRGPARRTQSSRSPRARLPACCASFHDGTRGVGVVGSAMPPPHGAVIVL